jgi:hypothetical protein
VSLRHERGSVMVLTAAAIFPLMMLLAFTIDTSHWFDYSRNLQNRADAAALAGAAAFGNICLEGGTPGAVRGGSQAVIGEWAQLYSGAGTSEPSGANNTQLPYSNSDVQAGTGWNVGSNGYLNNTSAASPVQSPLTLRLGNLNNYWLVLNGSDYAENGGTSFSMTAGGSGATFCSSDPTQDLSDPNRASAGASGPMVDVKVSQRTLPLFFPLIGGRPNIHAHARVQLEGESSTIAAPIAVGDAGYTPCVTVDFKNAADNSLLGTAVLTKEPQATQTSPIIWDNAASPVSVTMPASANVYIQPFLNNCSGSGTTYDVDTNSGIEVINTYGASTPSAGQGPVVSTGGVTLGGTCANSTDQYFSVGACTVQPTVHVAWQPGLTKNDESITAVDLGVTPNASLGLSPNNTGTVWNPNGNQGFLIGDSSGQHPIRIDWTQTSGTVGAQTCGTGNGSSPVPCRGTFNIQTQAFGACNGCTEPDDSGPIIQAQLRVDTDLAGTTGENAFQQGTAHNFVVTLQLSGLASAPASAGPADDVVLRYPTSGNHQTGLIDCGQGSGGSFDNQVVYAGCGPSNTLVPGLNPLYVYSRTPPNGCAPATDGDSVNWPAGNHQDCVATVPGTKNPICPLVLRMTGSAFSTNCPTSLNNCSTTQGSPCCPSNNWPNVLGGDPRAVTMLITSPSDFGAAGGPQGWLPIRRFATFYITGWDSRVTQCGDNDPFPTKGKRNQQNESVWGHWMNYSDTAGIGNNQSCPVNSVQPINCVPVLTR